jgi:hypothetical protein
MTTMELVPLWRCTMASPVPRVPPDTSARVPVNTVVEDALIGVSPLARSLAVQRPPSAAGGSRSGAEVVGRQLPGVVRLARPTSPTGPGVWGLLSAV